MKKSIRVATDVALAKGENRLSLVLAFLIASAILLGAVLVFEPISFLPGHLPVVLTILAEAGALFFVGSPLICGLTRYGILLYRRDEVNRLEVLHPFSSWRAYRRSLSLWLHFLFFIALAVGIGFVTVSLAIRLTGTLRSLTIAVGVCILLLYSVFFCPRFFLTNYLSVTRPEISLGQARALSVRMTRRHLFSIWLWGISFVPRLIIWILPMGVPLLLHGIPLMLISYPALASTLAADADKSKKENKTKI